MLHDVWVLAWFWTLKTLVQGCIGLLLENFFTGSHSVIILKNRDAICRTSLWMVPIYGLGGDMLAFLRWLFPWMILFVPTATGCIFAAEYATGWLLRKAGIKVWDYSHAKYGIHGLIRLDYLPFWMMMALGYDLLVDLLDKVLRFAGSLA